MGDNLQIKLDINNYVGNQFSEYSDFINGYSLSDPAAYFEYRKEVSKYIKTEAIKHLYDTLYEALRHGKRVDQNGVVAGNLWDEVAVRFGAPNEETVFMADAVINAKVIAISRTLNEALEDVIDCICPVSASGMAKARIRQMGDVRA